MRLSMKTSLANTAFVAIALAVASCSSGLVNQGRYSLRRVEEPSTYITGIALDQVIAQDLPAAGMVRSKRGVVSFQPKGKSDTIQLRADVFDSSRSAEDAALDILNEYTVRLRPGSRNGATLGSHSWYSVSKDGGALIMFVFRNGLYRVMSADYDVAEACCRKLLAASVKQENGVRISSSRPGFRQPRLSLKKYPRMKNRYTLTIQSEANQRSVEYRVIPSRGQILDTAEANRKILLTKKTGSIRLKLVSRSSDNLISPVFEYKLSVRD